MHVRIDSIEQALRNLGCQVTGEGYAIGQAVAADNLRLGMSVIADSVNPWALTRDDWRAVAERAGVRSVEVEVVCSDVNLHQRRVESRSPDIPRHRLPTWKEVVERDYQPWNRERIVIDTVSLNLQQCVDALISAISPQA